MLAKVCVMGDGGCGKTASVIQFVASHFVEAYDPTIEDSYRRDLVEPKTGVLFHCEFLDTAGQIEFSPLRDGWIRDSSAFLLMYNITQRSSLDCLDEIIKQIKRSKECETVNVPIILAGNKLDLASQREVELSFAVEWARARGIEHVQEFSAKTRENLTETIHLLLQKVAEAQGVTKAGKGKKKTSCNIL